MLRLRRYERLLVENRRFRSNGGRLTLNFRWKGSPPTNHSSSQKTRINVLSYGIKIWTDLSTVLSQYTRVTDRQTDRQTDGQTEFSSPYRVCITCSAVKTDRSQNTRDNFTSCSHFISHFHSPRFQSHTICLAFSLPAISAH